MLGEGDSMQHYHVSKGQEAFWGAICSLSLLVGGTMGNRKGGLADFKEP